ncbi:hypothetical protein KGF57_001258 [Candida theae]|uniref:Uncharacterized protein n=1 Tax=Candida theae TaxID=1198502 RepID=A0AAD5G014_9ASCO|nr:uncharacterized protein KGF57_001258 [Candida theae]KAI5963380.1 hypothetical protein KGF57_001258 [Candida theae]
MDNEYESINLASTLKSELPIKLPKRYQQQIPVSESESYDDDEFEHDPEEFITDKHADLVDGPHYDKESLHLSKDQSSLLADSNNTLNPSSLQLSKLVLPSAHQDFTEPMQYLSERIKSLERNLIEQRNRYSSSLKEGDSDLLQTRSKIQQIFHQLSECYFSLNELYLKDVSYTKSVSAYFDAWSLKRDKVLQKIQRAKSVESTHGAKLAGLLNESTKIDDEIRELQNRIVHLQEKKSILNKEIDGTTSVLESRTAICGENLRYLESKGKEVLIDYLSSNGFPGSDLANLIKERAVDLAFTMPEKEEGNGESHHSMAQIVCNKDPVNDTKSEPSIGMKPYEPAPETTTIDTSSQTIPSTQDDSLRNHGHGPTPFEKGYATGAQNSKLVKNQVQSIIQKVLSRVPKRSESPQPKSNLGSTMTLDVEPITTFLRLRIDGLTNQVSGTAKMAALYHECDKQWSRIGHIMSLQEERLEKVLQESNSAGDIEPVLHTLTQTRDQLESAARSISFSDSRDILTQLVNSEINAVIDAISIVKQQNERHSKQS